MPSYFSEANVQQQASFSNEATTKKTAITNTVQALAEGLYAKGKGAIAASLKV